MLSRSEARKIPVLAVTFNEWMTMAMKEFCKTLVRRIPAAFPHAAESGQRCGKLRLLSDVDLA